LTAKWSQAVIHGLARPPRIPTATAFGQGEDDGAPAYNLEKAKALIKDYGKPVEFKMIFSATPRGRANGQVLQQFWKQIGANMEIEQIDQASFPPRAFMRQFQIIGWRIIDLADPDPQMYANFHTAARSRSPIIPIPSWIGCWSTRASPPTSTSVSRIIARSAG
jgi:4-phytase/acid phosphatase/peptide/nickel transport system substrate-binding protein